jgi:hypothetical protein
LNGRSLSQNPYSHDQIQLLNLNENHQIEPELSILFSATYSDGLLTGLQPMQAMAHNDCSIRRKGARKISEKKNWGPASKGVSSTAIPLDTLDTGCPLDEYVLGCFLIRDGILHEYGQTSYVKDYSYFHNKLVTWMMQQFNTQQDEGPLENLSDYLHQMGSPERLCISIGATRYTEIGETTFLEPGDISCVVLYNPRQYSSMEIKAHLITSDTQLENASILKQYVYCTTSEAS